MSETEPGRMNPFSRPPALPRAPRPPSFPVLPSAWLALPALVLLLAGWVWFFWRIEPGSGRLAVLIRKTGANLPSGEIIARQPGQKGIQLEVLAEGRYFYNPYTWDWTIAPITDIPAGKLGVLVRQFGADLPPGEIVAGADTKGIVAEVLRPGRYRINPYAYQVQVFDAMTIRPGHVGVRTLLVGADVTNAELPENERNAFLVTAPRKGVVTEVLDPGSYYLNPYMVNVVEVNLQSQRFEMSGDDAITFLTLDGFTVYVEGTLEFSIRRDEAALITHRVGDMEDVIKKVILPRARGFSRIEGSRSPAINYIVGETRQMFQNKLEAHLRDKCREWGVDIKSVLIRNIRPPDEIASIIRDREVAVQNAKKFEQQIEQARSQAELTRQEMLAVQNAAKVEAETVRIKAVIQARQEQAVRVTRGEQELSVAALEKDAAEFQSQALRAGAEAEGGVIRLDNEAQAAVIRTQVAAFGNGLNFARYAFYEKIAPQVQQLMSSDDPERLGGLFVPLLPSADGKGAR